MKRSSVVTLGAGMALAFSLACAGGTGSGDDEVRERSDHAEVCIDEDRIIRPEIECEDGDGNGGFVYIPGSNYVGAHGSTYTGTYSTAKPSSGSIGRVPSSGGFGTHAGTGG